jgi:hypothetical protein
VPSATVMLGVWFTSTLLTPGDALMQPRELVPVTEKEVLTDGEMMIELPVTVPAVEVYVCAPDAGSVSVLPLQMVALAMLTVGEGFTVPVMAKA